MDKKKLELLIVGILIIVFVLALGGSFLKIGKKNNSYQRPQESASFGTNDMAIFKNKFKEEKKEEGQASWGKDPFVLQEIAAAGGSGIDSLKLMGITAGDKKKSKAIINNEIVSIGSQIGKFKVIDIVNNKVVVSDGEKNYDLLMQ